MKDFWSNICFYGRCIGIMCREWWRKVFVLAACAGMCGCMNCYFRAPWTRGKIEECYQSTRYMGAMTLVASFPQMMTDAGHPEPFRWENCFTIPFLGLPCLVDTACEACIDTVCLPVDWCISEVRED